MSKIEIPKPGRPLWKGHLKLALVTCQVALFKATSSTAKIEFNTLNRKTGNRLQQQMIDSVTREVVEKEQRVKGYEVAKNTYVMIEEAELEKIKPAGDKVIDLEQFVEPHEVEAAYQDERYYLLPDDPIGMEAFAIIRGALERKGVVGLGKIMLRSRQRPVMLSVSGKGLVATTLRYTSEIRSADTAFAGLQDLTLPKELLDIAMLLIDRKTVPFSPEGFVDAYEQGMIELIKAKQKGETFNSRPEPEPRKVVNLMDAFKASLAMEPSKPAAAGKKSGRAAEVTKLPLKEKAPAKARDTKPGKRASR